MVPIERVQTGVRLERNLLKVLKGLAEYLDLSLGDLLEGIVLHSFEGTAPFGPLLWTVVLQSIFILIGIFALVVPGVFLFVRLYVSAQAVVIEETRGIEAMRRSWNLTENN